MAERTFTSLASELIRGHEGSTRYVYKDTNNKWTVGIGHLIGDGSTKDLEKSPYKDLERRDKNKKLIQDGREGTLLKPQKVEAIFQADLPVYVDRAKNSITNFELLYPELQAQIVSATYRGSWTGSPKAQDLVEQGDFLGAADMFLDNDEYRDSLQDWIDAGSPEGRRGVAGRMEEVADALRMQAGSLELSSAEPLLNQLRTPYSPLYGR